MKKIKAKNCFNTLFSVWLALAMCFGASIASAARYEDLVVGNLTVERELITEGLLKAVANTSGNVWYVDSGSGSDGGGRGKSSKKPFATLDFAIGKCTANNGDFIIVMPGHAETLSGTADSVDVDVAGVTIVGLGSGVDMPEFTYDTSTDEFVIGAANVTVHNIRFVAGVTDIVMGISVETGGDDFTLSYCEFPVPGTATFEFLDAIDLASGADNFTCIGNIYRDGSSSAANHFIEAGNGVNVNMKIIGNDIYGRFAVSAIWSNQIDTGALIKDNVIGNTITAQHCIEFTTTANGMIVDNRLYADAFATTLDPGSMLCVGNLATSAIDEGGTPIPALGDSGSNILGADNSNNDFASTNVAANEDGSIIERMEQIQEAVNKGSGTSLDANKSLADALGTNGTTLVDDAGSVVGVLGVNDNNNAFDSSSVADNGDGSILERLEHVQSDTDKIDGLALDAGPVANSLAAFIASGGTALGTELADSKSIVDAIGTDGTTVADTATGVAGMIGVDDSNNVMATSSVVSNPDGSVYERQEYLQKLAEILTAEQLRSVAGSSMPLAVWYVDANIGASGAGTSPATAFKTMTEAITACSDSVDDWVLVFDYSGTGGTITINKAFVHIIGNANKAMPYPRIKPGSAVDGIEITAAGDRVEIANLTIGAGDQTKAAIAIDTAGGGGAYGVYIHDCVIGRDADAPALLGISVPSGGAAPYLVVENNRFYGSAGAGIAAAGSAIKIAGNATRCRISGNYISDVGRTATPAIWLSGSVTEPQIENNRIKTDTDTGTGSAITLAAGVDDGWIAGNWASDGKDAPAQKPYVDAGSTNGWSENYSGIVAVLP